MSEPVSEPRDRRPPPFGAHQLGSGPRILACGGRLWVSAWWSSEAEEVPDCSRLNWWVISNHQPPAKLRAGPQGTGESSKEWGDSEALPTPPGLCAWAGFPVSGERNAAQFLGSSGNGTMPFFFQLPIPGDPRDALKARRAAPRSWPATPPRRGASPRSEGCPHHRAKRARGASAPGTRRR